MIQNSNCKAQDFNRIIIVSKDITSGMENSVMAGLLAPLFWRTKDDSVGGKKENVTKKSNISNRKHPSKLIQAKQNSKDKAHSKHNINLASTTVVKSEQ